MPYTLQFSDVLRHLPYLAGGAGLTLEIAFVSFWLGAAIGLAGALGKLHGGALIRRVVALYVTFFTNTPALVQIFFLFYALPDAGITLSPMTAVLIGLTLNSGAYLTDILRSGIVSVRPAELETAATLGMSRLQTIRYVILPHIAKTIYAPLCNFFVWLVLGSSIGAIFGVEELTGRAINISSENLRTIETFSVVAAIYVALTFVASIALALTGRYAFRVKARIF
ncbi:amino acid ABC transporter permease [Paraburkholderia caballeronis]|uniref:amino acid ABC transporter permease n=1 Tax=Paraburkholderia caballeronis TaxID=416943 RepID=UPI00106620A2|nr:amino acid ABC transporter permease [Paraburkholderia caballeronis]TDV15679.1 amino acid ABC transporter membrane protein 1 (PAAT family) [Paraburkholderia caballeronis]TDV17934.1 amino acid ABC transporter membrane protein 1 (PAAT family) [Paraburkholderia caballeronis]TDV26452.1 amino acid ABC transporter membrane protein 1 (PAAT family) [Paraburkholderia caballeronis]TDV33608.1 amino acid ABC transporter membrane protein 1 (PAAT family) [Paraburkholderia caballeronis]